MLNSRKISVIIPCLNEAESIGKVISHIPKEVDEIVVVDNNSTDLTAQIAKDKGAKVVPEKTPGYGIALRTGFAAAEGEILATLDGDGQYPAEDISKISLELINNKLDFISANRFPLKNKKSLPFIRRFGNAFLTYATNAIFGLSLKDSQSGMWIFKKSVLGKIDLTSNDMPLSEEIKIKAATHPEIRFAESPIDYRPRLGDSKLMPLKHGFKNLWFLIRLRLDKFGKDKFAQRSLLALLIILVLQTTISAWHIQDPFVTLSADTAGENGLSAWNWIRFGPVHMKFGAAPLWLDSEGHSIPNMFYTHHPMGYVVPIYISYLIFGVNEFSTRIGTLICMLLATILFFFALKRIFGNIRGPFLTLLAFILMPGVDFYGKSPEITAFCVPALIWIFSLFILYLHRPTKTRLVWFFLSMAIGGSIGWFCYFMPASIWLWSLFQKKNILPRKKTFLFGIPIALIAILALTILHFYILNGNGFLESLDSSLQLRTSHSFYIPFLIREFWRVNSQNSGAIFLVVGILGFLFCYMSRQKNNNFSQFFPLWFMPILNAAIFTQWSTHPFGFLFVMPAAAAGTGILSEFILSHYKKYGWLAIAFIFISGACIDYQKLIFYYKQNVILGEGDVDTLKNLQTKIRSDWDVCMGQENIGLNYHSPIEWYLKRQVQTSPKCLENKNDTLAIVFNPGLGSFYQKEMALFQTKGFQPGPCADLFCFMLKVNEPKPSKLR